MLEPEEIKDLIADSIKSAVCIDDQYAEPYQKALWKQWVHAYLY